MWAHTFPTRLSSDLRSNANFINTNNIPIFNANGVYAVKTGDTFKGVLNKAYNIKYFVYGTMSLNGLYGSGSPTDIYVMPGGRLELDFQDLDQINIYNYGHIEWIQKYPKFINGAKFYSNEAIDIPAIDMQIRSNSLVSIHADVNIKQVIINHSSTTGSRAYFGSLNASERVESYNNAILYVDGNLATKTFKTNNNTGTTTYVDCRFTASTSAILSQSSILYVNGYMVTPSLEFKNKAELCIPTTGVISCPYINAQN